MKKEQVQASASGQSKTDEAPLAKKESAISRASRQNSLIGFKAKDVQEVLGAYSEQIANVLPHVLSADRMIAMAATEVTRNPKLMSCTPASLIGAVLQASVLGFQPAAALGYCYFVPYGNQVQFQIGYKGMLDLARRSGEILNVYAEVVREGDEFSYTLGLHRDLVHVPNSENDLTKPVTHAYAVVEFKDGGNTFVVLTRAEVERLRMRSPMQKSTPSGAWATDYEAMAKAKAIKQLAKYLPLSVDTMTNIAADEAVFKPESFDNGELKLEEVEFAEYVDEETGEVVTSEEQNNDQEDNAK